jgi:hypothetical protein
VRFDTGVEASSGVFGWSVSKISSGYSLRLLARGGVDFWIKTALLGCVDLKAVF